MYFHCYVKDARYLRYVTTALLFEHVGLSDKPIFDQKKTAGHSLSACNFDLNRARNNFGYTWPRKSTRGWKDCVHAQLVENGGSYKTELL